ncbi:MAG: DUF350 domain-containing protein [Bacillota bacterium]
MESLLDQIISTLVFGVLGIIMMVVGYKVVDFVIPADINKEIEKGNTAAGVIAAGVFIAIGIIVGAVVS